MLNEDCLVVEKAEIEFEDLSEDKAMELLTKTQIKIANILEHRKNNERLKAAKQVVSDLNSGYTGVLKIERANAAKYISRIVEIREGVNPLASV